MDSDMVRKIVREEIQRYGHMVGLDDGQDGHLPRFVPLVEKPAEVTHAAYTLDNLSKTFGT